MSNRETQQQAEAAKLDAAICPHPAQHGRQVAKNLKELGYER